MNSSKSGCFDILGRRFMDLFVNRQFCRKCEAHNDVRSLWALLSEAQKKYVNLDEYIQYLENRASQKRKPNWKTFEHDRRRQQRIEVTCVHPENCEDYCKLYLVSLWEIQMLLNRFIPLKLETDITINTRSVPLSAYCSHLNSRTIITFIDQLLLTQNQNVSSGQSTTTSTTNSTLVLNSIPQHGRYISRIEWLWQLYDCWIENPFPKNAQHICTKPQSVLDELRMLIKDEETRIVKAFSLKTFLQPYQNISGGSVCTQNTQAPNTRVSSSSSSCLTSGVPARAMSSSMISHPSSTLSPGKGLEQLLNDGDYAIERTKMLRGESVHKKPKLHQDVIYEIGPPVVISKSQASCDTAELLQEVSSNGAQNEKLSIANVTFLCLGDFANGSDVQRPYIDSEKHH